MSTMPMDPTTFQPMKVTASRNTEVGFELEPITKKMTLDKMRLHPEFKWPQQRNMHNDYAAAHKTGFPKPIVAGNQIIEDLGELLTKFFGKGYIVGGKLSVAVARITEPDDELTIKGVVKEKAAEGDAIRLILDVWCENQRGEKVIVGTASGLVT